MHARIFLTTTVFSFFCATMAIAQPYGEPDRGEPGDEQIQKYLERATMEIEVQAAKDYASADEWKARHDELHEQYMYMLGLSPLPEKNPLEATVTGTLSGEGYVVEKLHYQSRPHLYVTANLYRPAKIAQDERLPAVLYVCGHSGMGRNGNKTAFQAHGIWFARHGYVCLMVDTLQLGEIAAIHHGTYREGRWWWHSRGYTPAGVECWNGVRGIDYLISRPDVDPERIAVTGISGGGAATFWISAADERVKVAVPVSGMADLESYIPNRVINGHCDCMFLYNTYEWPWTRIAALIAPRPMLFVNSDEDVIFPMDANGRVINRLERIYSLYGKSDLVDSFVSIGGHAYRKDIRQGVYRFINTYLKSDSSPVTDSEVAVDGGNGGAGALVIKPEDLRVFETDDDLPKDELNTKIDEHFVPIAELPLPTDYASWRKDLMEKLNDVTFRSIVKMPDGTPREHGELKPSFNEENLFFLLPTDPNILVSLAEAKEAKNMAEGNHVWLLVSEKAADEELPDWILKACKTDAVYVCNPRGLFKRWTTKNPPNYVERSHVLLGRTVDTGRCFDVIQAIEFLHKNKNAPVFVAGANGNGILAAYAALQFVDKDPAVVGGVVIHNPPLTHMAPEAPQFLNILRVCDVPDMLGALAPLPLTISVKEDNPSLEKVQKIYEAAKANEALKLEIAP